MEPHRADREGPHYALDEVKKLVAADAFIVMKGRGLALLVPPLTYAEATGFVAAAHATVRLTYDVADEYGINIEGTGWYIKLCIDRSVPELVVISFHPPERPMRTAAGIVRPP